MNTTTQQCIDACNAGIQAANVCISEHIGEEPMVKCLQLCLDCTDLCTACVQVLARGSEYGEPVCSICADLCEECADECAKFDSESCQRCAEACRVCAEQCRKMVAHEVI